MEIRNLILLIGYVLVLPFVSWGQKNQWLSSDLIQPYMNQSDTMGAALHTSIRPFQIPLKVYPANRVPEKTGIDHISMDFSFRNKRNENAVSVSISPILSAVGEFEMGDTSTFNYWLSPGINTSFQVGEKLFGNLNLVENYASPSSWEKYYYDQKGVLPGVGETEKNDDQYSYPMHTGYVSYSPDEHFNFQLGRGKHFIGEGYRSLLLSDVAAPYDYLSIRTKVWNIEYLNLYTRMKDYTIRGTEVEPLDKYTTMHYLSWNISDRWNIGLFEGIVWQSEDSLLQRDFDIYYLNPIIFYRPVEFSVGSPDNALIGGQVSFKVSDKVKAYGQVMLDEFLLSEIRASDGWWANKQAVQLGVKFYDAFSINGFNILGEFNYIRPYTYSHNLSSQSYSHAQESLAHPLGANLREILISCNYSKAKWYGEARISLLEKGLDYEEESYGGNVLLSNNNRPVDRDHGNNTTQGLYTTMIIAEARVSRKIGDLNNMRIEGGVRFQSFRNDLNDGNAWLINLGIRSNLFNQQRDLLPQ